MWRHKVTQPDIENGPSLRGEDLIDHFPLSLTENISNLDTSKYLVGGVYTMPHAAISWTLQDYLRAIYTLEKEAGDISTSLLAERLGVTQPSVTSMLKKLAARKLISYTPYLSIALTISGERLALEIVRHHRLIEAFLQKALGYGLEELHDEAERLEHAISEKFEDRIDEFLGHPVFDPHGSPIPDKAGRIRDRDLVPLASLREGETAVVSQITCRDSGQLRYIESIGLIPGETVSIEGTDSGRGVLRLRLSSGEEEPVGESIACCVLVTRDRNSSAKG